MIRITIKVALNVVVSLTLSLSLLFLDHLIFTAVYANVLQIFPILVTAISALSFAFFTYTDNIEQKLSELYNKYSEVKIDQAHDSIGKLKKEIISNIALVIAALILEKVLAGLLTDKYILAISGIEIDAGFVGVAFRMTLFLLAILVVIDQFKAFISAIQYRQVVSKGIGK